MFKPGHDLDLKVGDCLVVDTTCSFESTVTDEPNLRCEKGDILFVLSLLNEFTRNGMEDAVVASITGRKAVIQIRWATQYLSAYVHKRDLNNPQC